MKLRTLAIVIVALLFAAIASPAQAMYHPGMGRFMQRDPGPGGISGSMPSRVGHAGISRQYADGMNLYQYVRSNPITLVDPMGAQATSPPQSPASQPEVPPPALRDGERWWNPDNHDIGIVWTPPESWKRYENCLGNACGINKPLFWNYDKGYVPKGCEEKPCDQMTVSSTPCKNCDVELIVAWYDDQKDKTKNSHAIGRDPAQLPSGWHTRDGDGGGSPSDVPAVGTGQHIRDIRDYNTHFARYFKIESNDQKPLNVSTRCFCCKSAELSPNDKGRLD